MLRGDEMAAAFGMAAHQDATPSHIRLLFCPLRCSHAGDLSCKEPGWKLCGWAFSNFPSYSELNSWMLTHGFSLPEPLALSFHWSIIKSTFTANGKVLHTEVTIPSTGSSWIKPRQNSLEIMLWLRIRSSFFPRFSTTMQRQNDVELQLPHLIDMVCKSMPDAQQKEMRKHLWRTIDRIISRRGMNTLAHDENGEPTLQTRNMSVQRELCSRARPEAGATDGYRFSVLKRPMRNRSLANIMDLG
ncbi:uncharacterized protein [Lolium perenne]|uniref:uncharacterized protein isoform X2 n=1 Tax=Lolium perenne TaxID=4522 RepID=UPI0021F64A8E|nr:uncharacterized protein LOC127326106 isoform X2 [Lolium perenne]